MMVVTTTAPINPEWHVLPDRVGQYKELLGGEAFFKWCHGRRMRRILAYQRTSDGKIHKLGTGIPFTVGWYCEVCERRVVNEPEMM